MFALDSHSASDLEYCNGGNDIYTLQALNVSPSSISYGTLYSLGNTGTLNQTATVTDTGNAAIDIYLSGTNLATGSYSIAVGYQAWSTSSGVNYGSGIDLTSASSTLEVDLAKPTTNPSNSNDYIYWGLGIPADTHKGFYSGTVTYEPKTY
jgi:hypothetical protein